MRALWRGCVPNVQRAALVNLGGLFYSNSVFKLAVFHTIVGLSHSEINCEHVIDVWLI